MAKRPSGRTKLTATPQENDAPTDLTIVPTAPPDDGDVRMHVKDLKPFHRQVRRHTPRNIAMIGDSLQDVGAARSIVLDEADEILAGAGTIEAASERGIHNVRIIEASGTEIIAVRRRGLTEEQKMRLALYDNRTADLAEYDLHALAEMLTQPGMDRTKFFNDAEFRMLEDRELANDLGKDAEKGKKETVPSMPEGYTSFTLVISDEANTEIRAVLEEVKTRNALPTIADALLVIVRAYGNTRSNG